MFETLETSSILWNMKDCPLSSRNNHVSKVLKKLKQRSQEFGRLIDFVCIGDARSVDNQTFSTLNQLNARIVEDSELSEQSTTIATLKELMKQSIEHRDHHTLLLVMDGLQLSETVKVLVENSYRVFVFFTSHTPEALKKVSSSCSSWDKFVKDVEQDRLLTSIVSNGTESTSIKRDNTSDKFDQSGFAKFKFYCEAAQAVGLVKVYTDAEGNTFVLGKKDKCIRFEDKDVKVAMSFIQKAMDSLVKDGFFPVENVLKARLKICLFEKGHHRVAHTIGKTSFDIWQRIVEEAQNKGWQFVNGAVGYREVYNNQVTTIPTHKRLANINKTNKQNFSKEQWSSFESFVTNPNKHNFFSEKGRYKFAEVLRHRKIKGLEELSLGALTELTQIGINEKIIFVRGDTVYCGIPISKLGAQELNSREEEGETSGSSDDEYRSTSRDSCEELGGEEEEVRASGYEARDRSRRATNAKAMEITADREREERRKGLSVSPPSKSVVTERATFGETRKQIPVYFDNSAYPLRPQTDFGLFSSPLFFNNNTLSMA